MDFNHPKRTLNNEAIRTIIVNVLNELSETTYKNFSNRFTDINTKNTDLGLLKDSLTIWGQTNNPNIPGNMQISDVLALLLLDVCLILGTNTFEIEGYNTGPITEDSLKNHTFNPIIDSQTKYNIN